MSDLGSQNWTIDTISSVASGSSLSTGTGRRNISSRIRIAW